VRRSLPVAIVVLLLAGLAAACGGDAPEARDPPDEPAAVSVTRNVPYMTGSQRYGAGGAILPADGATVMHRFVPEGDGPWPVVVLLHGGDGMVGWSMHTVAEDVAAHGIIVYTPTYLHDLDADADQVDSGLWAGGTLLPDLACAIRTARADAPQFGGDPGRPTLAGYSMGGAFGATVALVGGDPEFAAGGSGACVTDGGSAVPAAFVGWEGPYDWEAVIEAGFPEMLDVAPEAIRGLGPLQHLQDPTGNGPVPFHLRSGDGTWRGLDHAAHMTRFAEALTAAGLPVTTGILPGTHHTDFLDSIPEMIDLIVGVAYDPEGPH
jgi:dienelactone hydrolase